MMTEYVNIRIGVDIPLLALASAVSGIKCELKLDANGLRIDQRRTSVKGVLRSNRDAATTQTVAFSPPPNKTK